MTFRRASIHHSFMTIKLDMKHAYDHISRSFLEKALAKFDFHPRLVSWIIACIDSPSIAIIINGTLLDIFSSIVSLRYGCLLSPYLFIICADTLPRALHVASWGPVLDPYISALGARPMLRLLFVDDYLLVGRAIVWIIESFKRILEDYYLNSS